MCRKLCCPTVGDHHTPGPISMYADVKIRRTDEGVFSLLVNGEEMANHVLVDGLTVELGPDDEFPGTAYVNMRLAAIVDIDLPGAEVKIQ